jgi:Putative peptidoglycan binding domain
MDTQETQRTRRSPDASYGPAEEPTQTSGQLSADEARALLSELGGTPLKPGPWDDAAKAALTRFQSAEGLPATGELDPVTAQRLKQRYEEVSATRGAHAADRSPSAEAYARVEKGVKLALQEAQHVASELGGDAALRARYVEETKTFAEQILTKFKAGQISEGEAAYLSSTFRNTMLSETRKGISPAGNMLSKLLKDEGVKLPALLEKYANKLYGKGMKELSAAERNAVCLKVAEKAGITNRSVNAASKAMPVVGKAMIAITVAIAIYQIATAEDKAREGLKQGAALLGFWAGAKGGAALGGMVCSPTGPVAGACGVVGGLIGGIFGALLAEEAAERAYDAINQPNAIKG